MKHNIPVTFTILGIFLLTQILGLVIVNNYIDHAALEQGTLAFETLPLGLEAPQTQGLEAFITIVAAILIGTTIALILIKFKFQRVWKIWFLLAAYMTLHVAFGSFMPNIAAGTAALVLAVWKIYKPNFYVHNFTELFIYGGLAAIFVNMLDVFAIILILLFISAYDAYAVWKSKHMVTLAKFQTDSNLFAGVLIPYKLPPLNANKKMRGPVTKVPVKTAILGGGDIGFPLLFAGVLFKDLVLVNSVGIAFAKIMIVPIFATISLGWLLFKAEKNKFYPAMPVITFGCLSAFIVMKFLGFI